MSKAHTEAKPLFLLPGTSWSVLAYHGFFG